MYSQGMDEQGQLLDSHLLHNTSSREQTISLRRRVITTAITVFSTLTCLSAYASNCPPMPDISHYQSTGQWERLINSWSNQQTNCLRNSQYFSLMGAAHLNLGQYGDAQLALERALLLDANNGSAMLDYSQVLFHNGQLFAAIDLNQQLQQRTDTPNHLLPLLMQREVNWQSLTRQHGTELSISSGYNSNLNSAPDLETLAVTLGNQSGRLLLTDRSKEIAGVQANMILTHRYSWFSAEQQQQLLFTLDGRRSQDTESDQQRVTAQYISRTQQTYGEYEWDTRINYVHFGGDALYSDSEIGSRFNWGERGNQTCQPLVKGRVTYRHFYQDDNNDGALLALGTGVNCYLGKGLLSANIEKIENIALNQRAGDDRSGTQLELQWQQPLYKGQFSSYLRFHYSQDNSGYSPLLNDNEKRHILFSKLQFNYRQPIREDLAWTLMANFTRQNSNLELFEQNGQRINFGLEWKF